MTTPAQTAAARGCFVEASAGTGKTHTLVTEIASAIESGVPVDRIAAVTFTHAAAGSMKVRVRQELERRGNQGEALRTLDRAFIGTIHAFCAHLLRQRPVEACVDPDFVELDDPNARVLFDSVFRDWLTAKLNDPGPVLRRALARLAWSEERSEDGPVEQLRDAAWRLAEWRDYDGAWEVRDIDRDARLRALFEQLKGLDRLLRLCRRSRDPLLQCLRPVMESRERIARAHQAGVSHPDDVENELLSLKFRVKYFESNIGFGEWGSNVPRSTAADAWRNLNEALEEFRRHADADLASRLRPELWEVVRLYQQARNRTGSLDFQDLLISARDLLRHPEARRDLQARYDRIYIDEFQDTDPLQAEILLSLCGDEPATTGRLFVVGDPKQSIYRFRRADARQYRRIRENLVSGGLETRHLQHGRRSTEALHAFVNAAFADMPDALPLTDGVASPETQPAVVALPIPRIHGTRNQSGKVAAKHAPDTTAAFVEWLLQSNWTVRRDRDGTRGPIRPEDICILFRKTVSHGDDLTQEYVRALESRGIDHVLVGSKSFHKREEIGTLRAALRAIEWPDDQLSVYAVLRGALFFIPDSDLFHFRSQYGAFTPFLDPPADLDVNLAPIAEVLALLRKLHSRRNYRPPSETIRELLDAARAHVGLAFHTGGERRLANVFRLCDLARAFEASRPGSFRSFVEYLDREFESGEQSEAAVLEQQSGGVQLMTVHKAKGLEFPVVILADMTTHATQRNGCERYVDNERRLCAQKLCTWSPWELIDNEELENAEDLAESVRIGYVAATRAMDLLVVTASGAGPWRDSWLTPVYGELYPERSQWSTPESYEHLPVNGWQTVLDFPSDCDEATSVRPGMHRTGAGNRVFWFDPQMLPPSTGIVPGLHRGEMLDGTPAQRDAGLAAWRHWEAARANLIERASQPAVQPVLASKARSTPELDGIDVQEVQVEWEGQRPATRHFGRLVHRILEAWDPARIDSVAAMAGARFGATDAEVRAAAQAVRTALDHPLLREAAAAASLPGGQLLREYPISVALDGGALVEGVIDLAWSDGKSWTVVDYKTGRAEPQYRTQVRLYAIALQRATGLPARAVLLEV